MRLSLGAQGLCVLGVVHACGRSPSMAVREWLELGDEVTAGPCGLALHNPARAAHFNQCAGPSRHGG